MSPARVWISAAVVFAGALLLWNVLSGALSALILLFTAVLLSAGLRPIVDRMSKRIPFGAAVGVSFGVVIIAVVVIGFVLIQPLGSELAKLVGAIPGYAGALQDRLVAAQRYVENDETFAGIIAHR